MEPIRRRRGPVSKFTARLRKAERKRQLVAQAKQLFVALGYQHTTTEKIAEAAGVTEPVLYQHFPSKKALFLEVLQEIRQATLHRWDKETANITHPLEKLQSVVDLYLGSTRERTLEFRVMHRTLVEIDDSEIAACLRAFYLESEAFLTKILRQGQEAGLFRKGFDPRVGAWELIRTALGYTLTLPLEIPIYQEESYHQEAIAYLLHGMLA
ncbi:MAG: TetR/AcrR family transcriptional regulator [Gemmataceae bacterium]|nr:TetR/AcrR family transcriptional regulator [Gemmataceae bacterium]